MTAASTDDPINGCTAGDPVATAMDTIVLPEGVIDLGTVSISSWDAISLKGAGIEKTTIKSRSMDFALAPGATGAYTFSDFSLQNIIMNTKSEAVPTNAVINIDSLFLHASTLSVQQATDTHFTTTISNIKADSVSTSSRTASQISILANAVNPGDTVIKNVTMDGGASASVTQPAEGAIFHNNGSANDRLTVENTVITNYTTGLMDDECTPAAVSSGGVQESSLYVANLSIGGGNMQTGFYNRCGHLVVNDTTFHDITGQAILTHLNYQQTASSGTEVYNSTFTKIAFSENSGASGDIWAQGIIATQYYRSIV